MKRALFAMLLGATAPAYAANFEVKKGDVITITIRGRIEPNDFERFELLANANAVSSNRVVVDLDSSGGNVISGPQIGELIRTKRWMTSVYDECDSACAAIWLAGVHRYMSPIARIGFHAASINGEEKGTGNALGYEAVLWATTASPKDLAYLTPNKAKKLGIDVTVVDPDDVDDGTQIALPPRPIKPSPAPAFPPQSTAQMQSAAIRFITTLTSRTDNNAEALRPYYSSNGIIYYGNYETVDDVLTKTQTDMNRWPRRSYRVNSIDATCKQDSNWITCDVNGIISFQTENATPRLVGTASFQYSLMGLNTDVLMIRVQNGTLLTRQTFKPAPAPTAIFGQ